MSAVSLVSCSVHHTAWGCFLLRVIACIAQHRLSSKLLRINDEIAIHNFSELPTFCARCMCYDVFWCTNNVWLILVLVAVKGWKISISGSNHFYFICSFLWDHWYCWYCFTPQVVQQTFHFLGQAVVCHPPGCTSCENLTQDIKAENRSNGLFWFVASLFLTAKKLKVSTLHRTHMFFCVSRSESCPEIQAFYDDL